MAVELLGPGRSRHRRQSLVSGALLADASAPTQPQTSTAKPCFARSMATLAPRARRPSTASGRTASNSPGRGSRSIGCKTCPPPEFPPTNVEHMAECTVNGTACLVPRRACNFTGVAKQYAHSTSTAATAPAGLAETVVPYIDPKPKGHNGDIACARRTAIPHPARWPVGPSRFQPLHRLLMAVNGVVDEIVELFELGERIGRVGTGMKGQRANVGESAAGRSGNFDPSSSAPLANRRWAA